MTGWLAAFLVLSSLTAFAADARYVRPEISFEDGVETITEIRRGAWPAAGG